ncbi:MAG: type II secretion system major pseudopilin GspG [Planctomycetes bacterium]|nr:type II secretion system major pseudopilin GspG [Planctomycetota bacterium]
MNIVAQRRGRRDRRAFSLIELLIVIGILLAIGGLVAYNLLPQRDRADIDLTKVQIDQFESAMKLFNFDMRRWPTEEEGLRALVTAEALEDEEEASRWKGPYLEDPPLKDTWGSEWIYRAPSQVADSLPYDILSPGKDKEEDTPDDIHNHMRILNEEGEVDEAFDDFAPADGAGE